MKSRKIQVKKQFKGFLPEQSDFEIVEEVLPKIKGKEFLVKADYISVDPYMRSFASEKSVPYTQFGFQVGKVVESLNKGFPVNSHVVSHSGWRDYVVLDGRADEMFSMAAYQPPLGALPTSLAVGALGMPGITAYLGLLEIGKPQKGETVCVTSAAGAVGSLVGQIARIKHCNVIGFAGTDQKVNMLKKEMGFHHAFNYKTETNFSKAIQSAAPNGIDVYFDNVGGALSNAILPFLKSKGRVINCGSISTYGGETERRSLTRPGVAFEAFSFTQWEWDVQLKALQQMQEWIKGGHIKVKETITNGFEELPKAFIAMLKGENIGKALVKVWPEDKSGERSDT